MWIGFLHMAGTKVASFLVTKTFKYGIELLDCTSYDELVVLVKSL
jgi:hypothetical protein